MNGKHVSLGLCWGFRCNNEDLLVFVDDVMAIDFSFLDPFRLGVEL